MSRVAAVAAAGLLVACTPLRSTARVQPGWSVDGNAALLHPMPGLPRAQGDGFENTQYFLGGVHVGRGWVQPDGAARSITLKTWVLAPAALDLFIASRPHGRFRFGGGAEAGWNTGLYGIGEVEHGRFDAALTLRGTRNVIDYQDDGAGRFWLAAAQATLSYRPAEGARRVSVFLAYWRASTWVGADAAFDPVALWKFTGPGGCDDYFENDCAAAAMRRDFLVVGLGIDL
jgi:hypothetical protein